MSLRKPASLVKPPSLLDLREPEHFDEPILDAETQDRVIGIGLAVLCVVTLGFVGYCIWLVWNFPH
jgi:hypothetical protein